MKERGDTIIGDAAIKFGIEYRDLLSDQGVCIHVLGDVSEDDEHELLRFDCFDHEPHYHYGPQKRNERLVLDKTTAGDSLDWTLQQIRSRLPEMIGRRATPSSQRPRVTSTSVMRWTSWKRSLASWRLTAAVPLYTTEVT